VAISKDGRIVGQSGGYGVLWENGAVTLLSSTSPLATVANDISGDHVTGAALVAGDPDCVSPVAHAAWWTDGQMIDIDLPGSEGSYAAAVNGRGDIVGERLVPPCGSNVVSAFLYSNGVMYDLLDIVVDGAEQWTEMKPTGINDRGEIVGWGAYVELGGLHAFVMRPVALDGGIPEPGTLTLCSIGFAGLLAARWRKAAGGRKPR
jgi:uncharacterized membrane protein